MSGMKFSDLLVDKLIQLGYSHCYFVAGGNIMHMLNSVRSRLTCVPFAHEVGAAIATEYHNASLLNSGGRAFCLVTAGPGLTNAVTGIAGAWQESRELLILGGQVKRSDLATNGLRQRGIQEVDGVALVQSITKAAIRLDDVHQLPQAHEAVQLGRTPRQGPVFLELPLDVQATMVTDEQLLEHQPPAVPSLPQLSPAQVEEIERRLRSASRPVVLIGGGVERGTAWPLQDALAGSQIPIMSTYNGADRVDHHAANYFGRPNTWGMRYANIILQQADLILAIGTRLGLQQTGFNWEEFGPLASVIQIDIDPKELEKGHPRIDTAYCADANSVLVDLFGAAKVCLQPHQVEWFQLCQTIKAKLPLSEDCNSRNESFINPYDFWEQFSSVLDARSCLVPCSSGSSFTSCYQAITLPEGALMLSNKSQASMGYGLAGALGMALAHPDRRIFLVEGDGGFLQNMQELVVAARHTNNLGIFLWVNNGYASIRMTQKTYFGGAWLGCDTESGLGFPDWQALFQSFGLPCFHMGPQGFEDTELREFMEAHGTYVVLVPLDPAQTYFPKISSAITASGSMKSNPLHLIGPALPDQVYRDVAPHLPL